MLYIFIHLKIGSCSPSNWKGYDGVTCGACSALVNVKSYGKTCSKFCDAQSLSCVDAWDDEENEKCSKTAKRRGCEYVWKRTSDAICQCSDGTDGNLF